MAKKLFKFICYDIKNGLLKKWGVYIFTVIACMIAVVKINGIIDNASGMDYVFQIFSGIRKYYISPENTFRIPYLWLIFMIIPSFLVGYYAVDDLNSYGIQLIVRSRSKMSWWISKSVWCILSVVVYFAVVIATFFVYARLSGKNIISETTKWAEYYGIYRRVDMGELIFSGVITPALTIMALCMVQMLLSLIIGAMEAYVTVIVYDIVSAYAVFPCFTGNYAMILRNSVFDKDGLDFKYGLIINLSIIVITFIAGAVTIKKTALFKYSGRVV